MKRLLILSAMMLVTACAGRQTPIPNAESPEAKLYAEKCDACHSLPHPKRHSYAKWQQMTKLMESHIKEKEMAPLSDGERKTIMGYLKENAR